ncbi:hypothetical protein J3R82DRAFT_3909 [Butyriboletus roseoflavus]|nr:hypothetical protein J3R82DRAFT_3909 [Butyriboletus roseoflavus]
MPTIPTFRFLRWTCGHARPLLALRDFRALHIPPVQTRSLRLGKPARACQDLTSVSASRSSGSPVPQSPTRPPSSSLSSSTSNPVTAFNTFSRPLSTPPSAQTTTSSASSSSTSSVTHVDSFSISSSVTPIVSAITPFTNVTKDPPPAEPTSTPTPVSSTVSGTTTGTESVSASAYLVALSPNPLQQFVSTSISTNIQTTQPGSTFLATITSWSLVPIPTSRGDGSPNSSSTSNSLLPLILGPVLGVLVIFVLGMIVFGCRARRRAENMSNMLSSGSETSREQEGRMKEETRVNAVTVDRRITSYRGSSTYTPEHVITLSHAGKSSQNSNGQSSDPFVDRSEIVPSRTGLHAASTHSVDSMSTNVAFTVPVNAIARDVGEFGSSIDASTSSLGLHFVAPLITDDSSTRSPHLSPSWHYASTSSPREREHWNEEQQTSPVSLQAPASLKPFPLGMGNARLRLHALLEEARKI